MELVLLRNVWGDTMQNVLETRYTAPVGYSAGVSTKYRIVWNDGTGEQTLYSIGGGPYDVLDEITRKHYEFLGICYSTAFKFKPTS